ncbi:hypothetical protein E4U30_002080 [Claviceps sp. LM220 group G6]|nr:hypothetical protein E4U30_002080 [Claviceps sp. LM220 group G6]
MAAGDHWGALLAGSFKGCQAGAGGCQGARLPGAKRYDASCRSGKSQESTEYRVHVGEGGFSLDLFRTCTVQCDQKIDNDNDPGLVIFLGLADEVGALFAENRAEKVRKAPDRKNLDSDQVETPAS